MKTISFKKWICLSLNAIYMNEENIMYINTHLTLFIIVLMFCLKISFLKALCFDQSNLHSFYFCLVWPCHTHIPGILVTLTSLSSLTLLPCSPTPSHLHATIFLPHFHVFCFWFCFALLYTGINQSHSSGHCWEAQVTHQWFYH